jgi:oligopeptidase B
MQKHNSFDDFAQCVKHLINLSYVDPKKINSEGRSAGGLLVSASAILYPELFNTVIACVPFVDVMTTMADPTIPLTTPEWEEWGNPNIEEWFNYMLTYSPYDNIKSGVVYPHILALSGLNDPRVQYWEPTKFIAKLRFISQENQTIKLLKTDMNNGHMSSNDRYKHLKEKAFIYAFILATNSMINVSSC